MGSRDRPHKEVKKKPKDRSAQPKLQPLSDSAQAEVIRKERKPRRVTEDETDEG